MTPEAARDALRDRVTHWRDQGKKRSPGRIWPT